MRISDWSSDVCSSDLGFAYRWSTRFLCMDKSEAEKELGRLRRQWFAKRKNVVALLRETIFQQESPLVDTDASNKAVDADAALQELGSDQVAFEIGRASCRERVCQYV